MSDQKQTPEATDELPPLASLQALWQSEAAALPDVTALARRVRRKTLMMRLHVAAEVLITLVAFVLVWRWLPESPNALWLTWAVFVVVGMGASLFVGIRIRAGTWRADSTDLAGLVNLSVKRSQAALAMVRFCHITVAICLVFLGVMVLLKLREVGDDGLGMRRIVTFIGGVFYCLAFSAGAIWFGHRKRRELARWESLRDSLASAEVDEVSGHDDS